MQHPPRPTGRSQPAPPTRRGDPDSSEAGGQGGPARSSTPPPSLPPCSPIFHDQRIRGARRPSLRRMVTYRTARRERSQPKTSSGGVLPWQGAVARRVERGQGPGRQDLLLPHRDQRNQVGQVGRRCRIAHPTRWRSETALTLVLYREMEVSYKRPYRCSSEI